MNRKEPQPLSMYSTEGKNPGISTVPTTIAIPRPAPPPPAPPVAKKQ